MNASTRKRYDTDLSDEQWALLVSLIVLPTGGAPKTTNLREVLNGIFYQLRTGCQWRLLPHDFPPEGTVRRYFHYFKRTKQWDTINDHLRRAVRVQGGRDPEPSLAIIDSQTTKGNGRGEDIIGFGLLSVEAFDAPRDEATNKSCDRSETDIIGTKNKRKNNPTTLNCGAASDHLVSRRESLA